MYSTEYVTFREAVRVAIINQHSLIFTEDMIDDVLVSYDDFVADPEPRRSTSRDAWIREEATRLYFQKMGSTPKGQRLSSRNMRFFNCCVGAVCMITDRHEALTAMAA